MGAVKRLAPFLPGLVAVAIGAWSWFHVCAVSGRREAWDSEIYWTLALPVVAATAFLLGLSAPRRAWRWGALLFAGQALAAFLRDPAGNLMPMGLVLFAVLGALGAVPALAGAGLASRRAARGRAKRS